MTYLGDFDVNDVVRHMWNSNDSNGASITRFTNGTISVYKDGGTTQSTTGVTDTEDFDSLTGVHLVAIDTSADGTFYSAGSDFHVVLSAATIDTRTVNALLFSFSLRNRSHLLPTTAGRTLDVSAGGEAGLDWANIGSPTTTVNLSGTTVKTATDVETDTADIQTRLPSALVSGRIDANVGAISDDATAANNAEAFFDGTGYAGTNNVIPLVTTTTNLTNAATSGDLTATMKTSVNAEVVDALATDTYAEPGQGTPSATTTLAAKINYLYKAWRNKKDQTASLFQLYADDASTVDQKASSTSDGVTTTIGEIATGP